MLSRAKQVLKRLVVKLFPSLARRPPKPRLIQRASSENTYDAVDFVRTTTLDRMNRELIERIRGEVVGGRPLTVGFMVNDRSKWNADSLTEEIRREGWNTQLYLCQGNIGNVGREERVSAYQAEQAYFSQIDPGLIDLYDWKDDRVTPIEDVVKADVLFYQQPWAMRDFPRRMAGRTLNAYMHYGFMMMANHGMHYHIGSFHSYLWRYFTQTEEHRLLHLQHDPTAYDRLVVTGYPKFDVYLSDPDSRVSSVWPDPSRADFRVVYAPHHALGADNLGMSTFAWNHELMLELATKTPNTQWVYKPHPNLKYSTVRNNIMSRLEYTSYEAAWSSLPNAVVFDGGGYFDFFRSSDLLITDSGSFLAEYLPTGKPIIWLVSATTVGFNTVGLSLAEAYYRASSVAEIRELFSQIVQERKDPLQEVRELASRRLFPTAGKAATAIVDHLREQLATQPER
jgi:hypothetical protein